jgi:hypothetical protein
MVSDTAAVELPPPPPQDAGAAIVAAAELLWPAPAHVRVVDRRTPVETGRRIVREHLLAPNGTHPRLVVPAGHPRAAAAIAGRRRGSGGAAGTAAASAAAALVRSGLGDRLVRARLRITSPNNTAVDNVETQLGEILGTEVIVGLHVGTARVNRKPVLHVVDRGGRTLAFVKVGHTDAARELVRAEAATVRALEATPFSTVVVPHVIASTTWRDMELLVLSALTGRTVKPAPRNAPHAAMREVAAIGGVRRQHIGDSAFLAKLSTAGKTLPPQVADRYARALDRIATSAATVPFGSWHGDWQPFNMAQLSSGRTAVWDWERFADDVPVGFDALHFLLQVLLHQTGVGPDVERQFLAGADDAAVQGGAERDSASLVTAAYVAELAGRYLTLAEGEDGQLLARRASWSLGLLESCAARL